jgi:cell division transport system permease protein
MSSTFKDDLRSFRRSWVHHTGMQLATLSVLTATFTVVAFVFSISFNMKRILSSWGDTSQMTAYLQEDAKDEQIRSLQKKLEDLSGVAGVELIPREVATESFKQQMASYAPDLLADPDFSTPFPSSLKIKLKRSIESEEDIGRLEKLAGVIGGLPGVEDVSWGQGWVKNYSSVVSAINTSGGVMTFILLCGSLFVVGNSIRASISARKEEVEILELIGATSRMIRRPFVTEGLIMGALAATFAVVLNLALFAWQKTVFAKSLALARVVPLLSFLNPWLILCFLVIGAFLGALGAWLTVRKINDGWSARAQDA